ncbi:polyprotein [Winged bean alphaendornavirus 1]|uniref:Polyprotein n=1 Tax=Winged bean alphaendornavirus 1 TaxID=2169693 RepID=A0A1E1FFQ4_9VIRU|nr:polyprotein [Winged bean alphaendornavirus 1]BAV69339.1 polyprotein [Winged bean alphaendornavirus 1]
MACRKDEHREFIQFGPECLVPDLNHIDTATMRNFILLYQEGVCHIAANKLTNKMVARNSHLQNEEPFWGPNMRDYYSNKLPDDICPFKEDANKDLVALDLILRIIGRHGGSLAEMNAKSARLNPDMTPHIEKFRNKYKVRAMEMAKPKAVWLCAACNTLNFVWLEDEQTGVHGQHCGICFHALDCTEMLPDSVNNNSLKIDDTTQIRVGAIETQQLQVTNNTDGAPDYSAATLNTLIEQDMKNMRSAMSRRIYKVVYVSNGMTDAQLRYLQTNNLSFTIVVSRTTPNPHAMLASERRMAWYNFVERAGSDQTVVDIGTRRNRDTVMCPKWKGIGPCLDWRDQERYGVKPLPTNVCGHTIKTCTCDIPDEPLMVAIDSLYDISAQDVVQFMMKRKAKHLLYCLSTAAINFTEMYGSLYFNQGEWYKDGSVLVTSLAGDDRPYMNSWYLTKMWSTADVIWVGDDVLTIKTYMTIGNHILRIATINETCAADIKFNQVVKLKHNFIELTIPLLSQDSWLAPTSMPILVDQRVNIDVNLYHALYSRNLTNKLSFEKMVEFGLAFAHMKYTTAAGTYHNRHLTASDVRVHAMLAVIATRRKHGWIMQALELNEPSNQIGMNIPAGLMHSTLEYCISVFMQWCKSRLAEFQPGNEGWKSKLTAAITDWLDNDFWIELEEMTKAKDDTNLTEYRNPIDLPCADENTTYLCKHHKLTCDHIAPLINACQCCGIAECIDDATFCPCCKATECKHRCNHPCLGSKYHGKTDDAAENCECCGVKGDAIRCQNCIMFVEKHNSAHQPPLIETQSVETQSNLGRKARARSTPVTVPPAVTQPVANSIPEPEIVAHDQPNAAIGMTNVNTEPVINFIEQWRRMYINPHATEQGDVNDQNDGDTNANVNNATHERDLDDQQHIATDEGIPRIPLHTTPLTLESQVTNDLSRIASTEYAAIVRYGWNECFRVGILRLPDFNPLNLVGVSEFRFCPMGTSVISTDLIETISVAKTKGDGLCGYYALKRILGDEVNIHDLRRLAKKKDWFTNEDLTNYLTSLGRNSVVITPGNSVVHKIDAMSDNFIVIRSTTVDNAMELHWEPANVLQKGLCDTFPIFEGCGDAKQIQKLSMKWDIPFEWMTSPLLNRLYMAIELIKRNMIECKSSKVKFCDLKLIQKDNARWLTNNTEHIHEIHSGFFCFQIKDQFMEMVEKLTSMVTLEARHTLSTEVYDVHKFQDSVANEAIKDLVTETCAELQKIVHEANNLSHFQKESWETNLVKTKVLSDGRLKVLMTDHKLKTGDLVSVTTRAGYHASYVSVIDGTVTLETPPSVTSIRPVITLNIPKTSFKSKLILLMALQRKTVTKELMQRVLSRSAAVLGPGGSGKTTKLIEQLDNDTVAVARTRIAVDTIRRRAPQYRSRIMTYEKLLTQPRECKTLLVDEATMFNWLDLALILPPTIERLILFGDQNQVGLIDSAILGGTRYLEPVTTLIRPPNITTLDVTYRFGQTLANLLTNAGYKITSLKETDTIVEFVRYDSFDEELIETLVKTHRPDVVLTFYKQAKVRLKRFIGITVETVHSYQSCEADTVLIIQWNTGSRHSTIWMNKAYCVSAATRARKKLVWCTIGLSNRATLKDILKGNTVTTITGGARDEDLEDKLTTLQPSSLGLRLADLDVSPIVTSGLNFENNETPVRWTINRRPTTKEINYLLTTTADNPVNWYGYNLEQIMDAGKKETIPGFTWNIVGESVVAKTITGWIAFKLSNNGVRINIEYSNRVMSMLAKTKMEDAYVSEMSNFISENFISDGNLECWRRKLTPELQTFVLQCFKEFIIEQDDEVFVDAPETLDDLDTITSTSIDLELQKLTKSPQNVECEMCLNYPVMTGLLADYVQALYVNQTLTYTWQEHGSDQILECMTMEGVVFRVIVMDCGLKLKVSFDGTFGKITKHINNLVTKWNEQVEAGFRLNDLWQHLTLQQKQILKHRYGDVLEEVNSLGDTSMSVAKALEVIMEQEAAKLTVDLGASDSTTSDSMVQESKKSEHHTMYSALNTHFCTEADSWWNVELKEFNSIHVESYQIHKRKNTMIRLIAEQCQMLETCRIGLTLNLWGMTVTVHTFGGCSLCCGLEFLAEEEVILKISPQRSCVRRRHVLINTTVDRELTAAVCSFLGIDYEPVETDVSHLQPIEPETILSPLLCHPNYELGMIFERIMATPLNMWNYYKTLGKTAKLCTYYKHYNSQYVAQVANRLGPKYELAKNNSCGDHAKIDGAILMVYEKRTKKQFLCQLVNDKINMIPNDSDDVDCDAVMEMVNNRLKLRLASIPWKLAKIVISALHLQTVTFGTQEGHDIESLNLPLSYHKANKTMVYNYYVNKTEAMILANVKKPHHIVFVHAKQMEKYVSLLRHECQNLPVEIQNYSTIEHGFDQMVEQLHFKYSYNGLGYGETAIALSDYPYLSMLTSAWAAHIRPLSEEHNVRYVRNLLDTTPMLNKILSVYGPEKKNPNHDDDNTKYHNIIYDAAKLQRDLENGPWFTRRLSDASPLQADMLWLGLVALKLTPEQLYDVVKSGKYESIILLCPIKISADNDYFKLISEDNTNYYIAYDGTNDVTVVNKMLMSAIMGGVNIKIDDVSMVFHCTNNVLGHSTIKLTICNKNLTLPRYIKPINQQNNIVGVSFRIPVINDIRRALRNASVVQTRKVTIDHKLYRALSLRMLRPGTKLDDLLAYARTYAHLVTYSNRGVSQFSLKQSDYLMEACACVYFESIRANQSITKLTDILTKSYNNKWSLKNLRNTVEAIGLNILSDVAALFGSAITVDEILKTVESMLETSDLTLVRNLDRFCFVKLTKDIVEPKVVFKTSELKLSTGNAISQLNTRLIADTLISAGAGLMHWYRGLKTTPDTNRNHPTRRESCVSSMCRIVETQEGKPKLDAVLRAIKHMRKYYSHQAILQAAETVLKHASDPIQLTNRPNTYEQLSNIVGVDVTGKAEIKPTPRVTMMGQDDIAHCVSTAKWMYSREIESMHGKTVLFSTIGSMGDVEPFLGVAQWWKNFGVKSIFAVPNDLVTHVTKLGFECVGLDVGVDEIIIECINMENYKYNLPKLVEHLHNLMDTTSRVFDVNIKLWNQIMPNVDLVMETPYTHVASQLAQKFNKPLLLSAAYPWEYHRFRTIKMKPFTLFDVMGGAISYAPFQNKLEKWRSTVLDLTNQRGKFVALGGNPMVQLHEHPTTVWDLSYSSTVIGYPVQTFMEQTLGRQHEIDALTINKIAAVCFGSMVDTNFTRWMLPMVTKLSNLFDHVIIVGDKWRLEPGTIASNVSQIGYVNYHQLFPLVDLVVTHGGSGTTHNALRHGCVVAIQPFFGDQFAWLEAVEKLGIGMHVNRIQHLDKMTFQSMQTNLVTYIKEIGEYDVEANLISSFNYYIQIGAKHIEGLATNVPWPVTEIFDNNHDKLTNIKAQHALSWVDLEELGDQLKVVVTELGKSDVDDCQQRDGVVETTKGEHEGSTHNTQTDLQRNEFNRFNTVRGTTGTSNQCKQSSPIEGKSAIHSKLNQHQSGKIFNWKLRNSSETAKTARQWIMQHKRNKQRKQTKINKNTIHSEMPTTTQLNHRNATGHAPTSVDSSPSNVDVATNMSEIVSPSKIVVEPVALAKGLANPGVVKKLTFPEVINCKANVMGNNHLAHVWKLRHIRSEVSGINETNCGTTCRIEPSDWTQLYDPKTQDTCVHECIMWISKRYGHNISQQQLLRLFAVAGVKGRPTMQQTKLLLLVLGLPVLFLTPQENLALNCCTDEVDIGVKLFVSNGTGHCKIVKIKKTILIEELRLDVLPKKSDKLQRNIEEYLSAYNIDIETLKNHMLCDPTNIKNWHTAHSDYSLEELKHKLKFVNLKHTIKRSTQAVHTGDWVQVDDIYFWYGGSLDIPSGVLLLYRQNSCYYPAFYFASDDGAVMIPMQINANNSMIHDIIQTEIKVVKEIKVPKTVRHVTNDMGTVTCLNQFTRSVLATIDPTFTMATVNDPDANYLYIYEYDGRTHHKYDELQIILRFDPNNIIGVGFDFKPEWVQKLKNITAPVRYAVYGSKLCLALELNSQHQADVIFNLCSKTWSAMFRYGDVIIAHYESVQGVGELWWTKIGKELNCTRGTSNLHVNWLSTEWFELDDEKLSTLGVSREDLESLLVQTVNQLRFRVNDNFSFEEVQYEIYPTLPVYSMSGRRLLFPFKGILLEYQPHITGGSTPLEERVLSKLDSELKPNKLSRWWDLNTEKPQTSFDMSVWEQRLNTEALMAALSTPDMTVADLSNSNEIVLDQLYIHNQPSEWPTVSLTDTQADEDLDWQDLMFWHDTDLSDWNEKYAPTNDTQIKGRKLPTELKVSSKTTLVEYPKYARPVLTKAANQEFNAITGRLCKVETYRKYNYDIKEQINLFVTTYVDPNKLHLLSEFKQNELTMNDGKVLDWLRDRPDANKIAEELEMILAEGLEVHPINDIKVHLKLESLLKEEPATHLKQVKARALMWQCKGYCSIFSHIFKEIKTRLKSVLKPNIVYTDGLRADELSSIVRNVKDFSHFLENDLVQQDRQTDHEVIKFEMQIYKLLGANADVINLWHNCHFHWKYKAASAMGIRDAMRLTGQATTAIGNCLTNLLVHMKLVKRLGSQLKLFLVLGDDGLMLIDGMVNTDSLNRELKVHHNMMCKPKLSSVVGTFCCMIVGKNHLGGATLGPDFVRLRRRFEVTNGVSEANDDNLRARSMSYLMFLGDIPEVRETVANKKFSIEPLKWYDYDSAVYATASKYAISETEVENNKLQLLAMINNPITYQTDVLHWYEGK